ncbi:ABC transporter ATP-binding protein [Dethiobacter alkaliphilus]|uniref:ABC transporter ATP-binding protein n=1 Tax=Dethiobacter alkaliphilus TaxID=427926 RepID=UPI002227BF5F|nr:ABC transporter ATP-binding protein [Dethiobacter alkaliphilus]MCW3490382.1 ABC transporter ATP-binding protein [Dethiobacter alkaliphilus]
MTKNALEVNNLTAYLGDFALRDINVELEQGTIMGLVGRNGAGKTTLIKTILDMIPKAAGEVLFNGIPLYGNEVTVKAKIGVVYDKLVYPENLKPGNIKNWMAPFYRAFDYDKFDKLMERFELNPKKKLSTYSKGMQMKFSIVMALCHDPDLVILDEPTAGLDPVARADVLDLLMELMQSENKSLLFSTHITSDLDKIADYLTIINEGKIVLSRSKDELLDTYALVQIDKATMTDTLKSVLFGVKETAFGYVGLGKRNKVDHLKSIKTARPTIEDMIVYLSGEQSYAK